MYRHGLIKNDSKTRSSIQLSEVMSKLQTYLLKVTGYDGETRCGASSSKCNELEVNK
jgi:hypothetical protein